MERVPQSTRSSPSSLPSVTRNRLQHPPRVGIRCYESVTRRGAVHPGYIYLGTLSLDSVAHPQIHASWTHGGQMLSVVAA